MKNYKDVDGDSGVLEYEYGEDWINVKFSTGAVYEYTYASAGAHYIELMKRLADAGVALNDFIQTHVKHKYSRRAG